MQQKLGAIQPPFPVAMRIIDADITGNRQT
jgi:hypothetical protein